MNKKGIYSAVFGLMAIIVSGLLLTTAYTQTKYSSNIAQTDDIVKVKKTWQNFYLTSDSIASKEFSASITQTCHNAANLGNVLSNKLDLLKSELDKTNVNCTHSETNLSVTQQGQDCKLSFNISIKCTKKIEKNGTITNNVEYEKIAKIISIKPLQAP